MSLCNREASVVRLSVCKLFCANCYYYHTHDSIATKVTHDGPRGARIQGVQKVNVKVKGHVIRTLFCLHKNRFFYHKYDWIATKLALDGPHMDLHPGCAQGQDQGQRSRDTDTFLTTRKSLLLPQTWLDHHQTCTRRSPDGPASRMCSRSRSKITWYGHFCNFTKIASSCRQTAGSRPNLHTMVRRRARIHDVLKVKVKVKGHVIWALLWCHEMFDIQYGLTFCLYMRSLYETPLYSPSSISIRQLDV